MLSLNDFFTNLSSHFTAGIHYISVGCAHFDEEVSNTSPGSEQQYPPFLRQHDNIHTTLVLIDYALELPPKCLTHINDIEMTEYKNVFKSKNKTIYCFQNRVSWTNEQHCTNIYSSLLAYHNYILQSESLFFFHDFTGRDIHELADIMDTKLITYEGNIINKTNLKKIMYDITLRQNIGCFVNLNDEHNMPIIDLKKLEIINPFVYHSDSKYPLLPKQRMKVVNLCINDWFETHCVVYRSLVSLFTHNNQETKMVALEIPKTTVYKELSVIFDEYLRTKSILTLEQCIDMSKIIIFNELYNLYDILGVQNTDIQSLMNTHKQKFSTKYVYAWSKDIHNHLLLFANPNQVANKTC